MLMKEEHTLQQYQVIEKMRLFMLLPVRLLRTILLASIRLMMAVVPSIFG
jgi:hypothetical protein